MKGLVALLLTIPAVAAAQQTRDTVRTIYPDTIVARLVVDTTVRRLRVCAGGDITLGSNLDSAWAKAAEENLQIRFGRSGEPDSLLAPLHEFFRNSDIVLVNVEGAIGEGPAPRKCVRKSTSCYAFRSPPSAAGAIRRLGSSSARVVGNVANNHSHDAGNEGLRSTMSLLDSAGVHVTGVDTLATSVVTERGDTVAFLGFYTGSDTPDARDLAAVRRHVSRAAAQYGVVIVTMHLGAEGAAAQRTRNVNERFVGTMRGNPVAFAKTAIDAGATAVIGHGPHVLRAGEWRDSSLVLYSLGNLLNYGTFSVKEPMNRGAVACFEIAGPRKVTGASIASTVQIAPGVVLADWSTRAAALIDSLSRVDFRSTGVSVGVDGTIGRRPAPAAAPARKRTPPPG